MIILQLKWENMRRLAFLCSLLCLTLCCGCDSAEPEVTGKAGDEDSYARIAEPDAAYYTDFFVENCVHDLYIEIGETDWQAILGNPEAKEYCSVTATIDSETISNVGFRTRGSSSLRMALRRRSERYPFRLKFDEYVDNQRFLGLDELILTNSNDDPSYIREYLGYEAFRQLGMETPLVTFFNLYINGELHGLYVGVEAVDNRYLNRVFGEHRGNLYEAGLQATLGLEMDLELMEQKKGQDKSKSDIAELVRVINEMPLGEKGEIERVLDVDSVLQYFAGNAVVHNWDDYAGQFSHNYYLYSHNGVFHMIPWDMNESFLQTQAYYRESDGARQEIAVPVTGSATLEARPLVKNLLAVSEYNQRYLAYCDSLRQWLDSIPEVLSTLQGQIQSSAENDPTSFFSYEEFQRQYDPDYSNGLAGFCKERADYLKERLPVLMSRF